MRVPLTWLAEFVDYGTLTPAAVADLLTMRGIEVEQIICEGDESILECNITPNRPDCLSIYGIAREVATATNTRLPPFPLQVVEGEGSIGHRLRVTIDAPADCLRYAARRIDGVRMGPSPAAVQRRLACAGIRAINTIVDATNYVMLELGQPLHAFDASAIGGGHITVRTAGNADRAFQTLDGTAHRLEQGDLLICDRDQPIALAGIMGGANSEVQDDTTSVILESAYFSPSTIRRTSKRLGLISESSRRFERGVDPNGVITALQRATALLVAWSGGVPTRDWIDLYPVPIAPRRIPFAVTQLKRILGIPVTTEEAQAILQRLGCAVEEHGVTWTVTAPTFRPDLERPIDLIEEIARIYGYDRIPPATPTITPAALHRPVGWRCADRCLTQLQALGFAEMVHYAFLPATEAERFPMPEVTPVALKNPLGQEPTILKTTLVSGLVATAALNLRHGQASMRCHEWRPVFRQGVADIEEAWRLAVLMMGRRYPFSWTAAQDVVDFFDIKGLVELMADWTGMTVVEWRSQGVPTFCHPGRSALFCDPQGPFGYCGELHPALVQHYGFETPPYVAELDWSAVVSRGTRPERFVPIPRFPAVRRDISLSVDRTMPVATIAGALRTMGESWMTDVTLFDLYEGERLSPEKKSVAFAIRYQHPERTLTDDEVNQVHQRAVEHLVRTLSVEVRQ
ncbi:MAG: phenylalanine--tRNA ligase subunit beta [Deltaproteobacteria bacterium]|nr:phenylalanine--tRNA ligase subunit beta [Deltaproteobacteria bacterium]